MTAPQLEAFDHALFERPAQPCRSVVALRASAADYLAWRAHLKVVLQGRVTEEDHTASLSLYFRDPDGNPYEITTYDVGAARSGGVPSGA